MCILAHPWSVIEEADSSSIEHNSSNSLNIDKTMEVPIHPECEIFLTNMCLEFKDTLSVLILGKDKLLQEMNI